MPSILGIAIGLVYTAFVVVTLDIIIRTLFN